MELMFTTSQPLDFTNVWYVFGINTSGPANGTNGEPYAVNGNQNQNWLNYSYEIIVYQLPGQSGPQAALIEFVTQSLGGALVKVPTSPLTFTPQQMQLIPNCDGTQTKFCVIVDRHIFSGITPTSNPSPTTSPSSSPSTSPSPSSSPSTSPSPSASPSPPAVSGVWYINWFTELPGANGQGAGVIDAPGALGPSDQTWQPPNISYDTSTSFDWKWTAVPPPGWPQVNPAAAQIAGGEVINVP